MQRAAEAGVAAARVVADGFYVQCMMPAVVICVIIDGRAGCSERRKANLKMVTSNRDHLSVLASRIEI